MHEALRRLEAGTRLGDPSADAVVAAFAARPGDAGWATLGRVLAALDGAADRRPPAERLAAATTAEPELRTLLAPLVTPPAWYDPELAVAGAVAFWRVGSPTLLVALTYGSLAFGYRSARLSRPLAAVAAPDPAAPPRPAETPRWALTVTAPGAAAPGAAGWAASIRLRLERALIRRRLLDAPWWRHAAWGVPLSAADGFATVLGGFCVVPLRAMRDLGVRFTPAEEAAICHLWRWIGYVLGVPEELLPAGARSTREWVDAVVSLDDDGPTVDGPRLMQGLLADGVPVASRVPGPAGAVAQAVGGRVAAGFTRRWLGDETADRLGVPRLTPAALVPLLRPLHRVRDVIRASGVVSDERLTAAEIAVVQRLLALRQPALTSLEPEREAVAELARPPATG